MKKFILSSLAIICLSMYTMAQLPVASFSLASNACLYSSLSCADSSGGNPTSWQWSISPNIGVSSSSLSTPNSGFHFNMTGTYSITLKVSNANGADSITKYINITAPTISVNITPPTLCVGSSCTLTASGAVTYDWLILDSTYTMLYNSPPSTNYSVVLTPTSSISYTVQGADGNGCYGNDILATASVKPSPTAIYTLTASGIQHVWDATPSISGGALPYSYLWSWGDGTSDNSLYASHTYTASAHYNVCFTVTDNNGCADMYCQNDSLYRTSSSSSIVQINVVNNSTGFAELDNSKQVLIYPNPTSSTLNLQYPINNTHIMVYDLLGNILFKNQELKIQNGIATIDISSLPTGIYFIKVGVILKKFIKL